MLLDAIELSLTIGRIRCQELGLFLHLLDVSIDNSKILFCTPVLGKTTIVANRKGSL
jgi:hypothetical protein